MFVIVGIVNLWAAYFIFKLPRITFHLNDRVLTYNRADFPALFNVAGTVVAVIGMLVFASGVRLLLAKPNSSPTTTESTRIGSWHLVWGTINSGLLFLLTWSGYATAPIKLRGANPDPVLSAVVFSAIVLFAIAAPHLAKVPTFRKPQWGRPPLNWWRDPLQSLFVATCWWAGFVVGNLARLFTSNLSTEKTVLWTVLTYVAILAGLLVGQTVAYVVYRDRIES